jgi:hypothetical protein
MKVTERDYYNNHLRPFDLVECESASRSERGAADGVADGRALLSLAPAELMV